MSVFTLNIELGNVAMASAETVAEALRQTAERVLVVDEGVILDTNGNTVGNWAFEYDEDEDEDDLGHYRDDYIDDDPDRDWEDYS